VEQKMSGPRKESAADLTASAEVIPVAPAVHVMQMPLEDDRDKLVFDWSQKLTCACCGFFSFLMQCILVACMGSFLFGFNISLLNTSIGYITWEYQWCDFLGEEEIGGCSTATNFQAFISTAIFIGAAIGSMTGGVFMSYGRRGMILLSMCVFIFGIISSVCANSFSALLWARLVCGYAVGLVSVCVPSYLSEVTPPTVRGQYGVFHQLFITIGIVFGNLIGLPTALSSPIPSDAGPHELIDTFSQVWWRFMLGVGILPVLLIMYLLMKVYTFETPHYFIENNHYGDAEMLLRKLLDKPDVKEELKAITDEIEAGARARAAGMSLGVAWGRSDFRKVIIFGCVLSAFQQLGGINVFMASSTQLFKDAGLTGSWPAVMTVIMSLINCLMTLPAVPLIEKMGRRSLMVIGTIAQTLSVLPATICYWALEEDSDVTMWLAIVGCLGYIIFFAATYGPILWVYLFEIYPIEIKGSAAGLATAFNWIAGIIMVFVQNYLENDVLYLIFTIMCAISAVIVFFFMLETKGRQLGDSPFINRN
jgi:SP family sugar:H+ symporter-like MFS transporter